MIVCTFVLLLLAIVLSGLLRYTDFDYLPLVSSNSSHSLTHLSVRTQFKVQGRIQEFKLGGRT